MNRYTARLILAVFSSLLPHIVFWNIDSILFFLKWQTTAYTMLRIMKKDSCVGVSWSADCIFAHILDGCHIQQLDAAGAVFSRNEMFSETSALLQSVSSHLLLWVTWIIQFRLVCAIGRCPPTSTLSLSSRYSPYLCIGQTDSFLISHAWPLTFSFLD